MSAGKCWRPGCESTDTRRYLNGPACVEHTPAKSRPVVETPVSGTGTNQ